MTLPDPHKALQVVKDGLARMAPEEREAALFPATGLEVEISPDEVLISAGWRGHDSTPLDDPSLVLMPTDQHVQLDAYLACALTDLEPTERDFMFTLSHLVSEICSRHGISLYEPRNVTDPVHNADIPDWEVWHTDRERVVGSDLLIHLAHFPSTGSGQELSFAFDAMVPIIVVSKASARVSRMVTGIPGMVISIPYAQPEELAERLESVLQRIRPVLVQRKTALHDYEVNVVGERIRQLREAVGMSRASLARASTSRCPISEALITRWETSTDRTANPSLIQLHELARLLNVTVTDIVEPNLEELIWSILDRYVRRQAARGSDAASDHDRRAMVRKMLLRAINTLED